MQSVNFSRRQLLATTGLTLGALQAPNVWAQALPQGTRRQDPGRIIVVLLRGAYDGLSAFVPYSDGAYYEIGRAHV